MRKYWQVLIAALLGSAVSPAAAIVLDGQRFNEPYGPPLAIQTVQTGFGDNQSELNALYARVVGDDLFLMLTGNLETNGNRINLFFDTQPGGMNRVIRPASAFDDLTFDEGFAPDYFSIAQARRSAFDFRHHVLGTDVTADADGFNDVFEGENTGIAQTPVGEFFDASFGIAFDNSNEAGVTEGETVSGPADAQAAADVRTGLELRIPLSAIGNPQESFRLLAFIVGRGNQFLSNQFLPGLEAPQENLGSDGLGNSYATLGLLDFNDIPGEQFLEISLLPAQAGDFDGSGTVEQGDLNLVLNNWGSSDLAGLDGWVSQRPVLGQVDQGELNIVLNNWGSSLPPSMSSNGVPEPIGCGTVALVGLAMLRRRS
ncbi:MAG: hypothetical protein AAF328_11440 [Planctomycetota bacterium]